MSKKNSKQRSTSTASRSTASAAAVLDASPRRRGSEDRPNRKAAGHDPAHRRKRRSFECEPKERPNRTVRGHDPTRGRTGRSFESESKNPPNRTAPGHDPAHPERARSFEARTEDWEEFRTLGGTARQAGVATHNLPALVAKELVDNALDAGVTRYSVSVSIDRTGVAARLVVTDEGPGLRRSDLEIAELFSIGRPMVSTKRLRRITRGALGNGLRVVAATVLASGGRLWVATGGRRLEIVPKDDGSSEARPAGKHRGVGTRVEVQLGGELAELRESSLRWARLAIALAPDEPVRECRSSPHWYASDTFHALLQSAGTLTVRDVVESLDGCSGGKAGDIAGEHRGQAACELTLDQAEAVLSRARLAARPVTPQRLGCVGKEALGIPYAYAKTAGEFQAPAGRGDVDADVPFVIECWARAVPGDKSSAVACVNRTPTVGEVSARCQPFVGGSQKFVVETCGVELVVERAGRNRNFEVLINVQCPALGFTTNAKSPDYSPMEDQLEAALEKAVRKARSAAPREPSSSPAALIVREALQRWEHEWKPDGLVPTLRQVFYALAVAKVVSKDDSGFKRVGTALARAREEGTYPWEGLVDPLREVRRVTMWSSVDEFLTERCSEYCLDKWSAQPLRVELWSEKEALAGALEPIAMELEVPFLVARGYASVTAKHAAVERFEDGQPTVILYVGDFDPSGLDMSQGAERWIREQLGESGHVTFTRVAVTEADFRSGRYPTLAVNDNDARAAAYRELYGKELMETEALPARELRARVRQAVLAQRDERLWKLGLDCEAEQRVEIERLLARRSPGKP